MNQKPQIKSLDTFLEKADKDHYAARFVVSSVHKDRDNDTFSKSALQALADQGGKTIALWQHRAESPIGFFENLTFDGANLKGYLKLATTNLAKMVATLLEDKTPLSTSVGFRAEEAEPNKHGGYEFQKVSLHEISVVSVPANARAIQVAKSFDLNPDDVFAVQSSDENIESSARHSAEHGDTVRQSKMAILSANKLMRR